AIDLGQIQRDDIAGEIFDERSRDEPAARCHLPRRRQRLRAFGCGQQMYVARVHVHRRRQACGPRAIQQTAESVPVGRAVCKKRQQHGGDAVDGTPGQRRADVQIVILVRAAAASLAAMQARAESIARSGPHATGCPVRTARQNRAISSESASDRSATALPFGAVDEVDGDADDRVAPAFADGFVSEAAIAAPPGVPDTSIAVAAPPPPSLKSSASDSLYMMSVAFV